MKTKKKKNTTNLMMQMSSDYYLPAEVLTQILIRLPVRSLLRCTSVCKSWYSLITSPNFITTHLNNPTISSNNQTPLLMVKNRHITLTKTSSVSLVDYNYPVKDQYSIHWDNDTFDEFAKLDFPFITSKARRDHSFRIVGICNGLVCLFGNNNFSKVNKDIIALWNPSLRKSLILPKPRVRLVLESYGCIQMLIRPSIGFGFDCVTNDHKVVRLTYHATDSVLVPPEVELFELSTGSWRYINVGDFPYVINDDAPQAFLNGVVHWAGYSMNEPNSSCYTLIVSFDVRNDTLGIIMVPACVRPRQHWDLTMHVTIFGESLSFSYCDVHNSWCIWVMKEYGVESSWTKQFNIDLGENLGRPVWFKDNGNILLENIGRSSQGAELDSYDPTSKVIKNLNIHGMSFSFCVGTYNESLILSRGLNKVLGRQENSGGVVTCRGTSVLPREDDEVKGKRTTVIEE